MSKSLLSKLAALGLLIIGAQESSELKLLPLPSLSSKLTSRLPLATLASFRSIEPECEWAMLKMRRIIGKVLRSTSSIVRNLRSGKCLITLNTGMIAVTPSC